MDRELPPDAQIALALIDPARLTRQEYATAAKILQDDSLDLVTMGAITTIAQLAQKNPAVLPERVSELMRPSLIFGKIDLSKIRLTTPKEMGLTEAEARDLGYGFKTTLRIAQAALGTPERDSFGVIRPERQNSADRTK